MKFFFIIFAAFALTSCFSQVEDTTKAVVDTAEKSIEKAEEVVEQASESTEKALKEAEELLGEVIETDVEFKDDTNISEPDVDTEVLDEPIIDESIDSDEVTPVTEIDSEPTAVAPTPGSYAQYSPDLVGTSKTTILSFSAAWCPSCQSFKKDVKASIEDIPDGVAILEVDFDTSDELKEKYNVVGQHTFVLVDEQGNEIRKWRGGNTLEDVLESAQV